MLVILSPVNLYQQHTKSRALGTSIVGIMVTQWMFLHQSENRPIFHHNVEYIIDWTF